jgi:hypothetical protein
MNYNLIRKRAFCNSLEDDLSSIMTPFEGMGIGYREDRTYAKALNMEL